MPLLRRRRTVVFGLTETEMTLLATYNSECHRGLIHTDSWRDAMRELQRRYDAARPGIGAAP